MYPRGYSGGACRGMGRGQRRSQPPLCLAFLPLAACTFQRLPCSFLGPPVHSSERARARASPARGRPRACAAPPPRAAPSAPACPPRGPALSSAEHNNINNNKKNNNNNSDSHNNNNNNNNNHHHHHQRCGRPARRPVRIAKTPPRQGSPQGGGPASRRP